jgi:GNAT superfamily N-acetyltransferase
VQIVDVTESGPLLDAVYADVLAPSFPSDELESRESLGRGIATGDTSLATILDATGAPVAAAVVEWSPDSRVLLLSYLAVRPGERGGGYGAALLGYAQRDWVARYGAWALVAEIEHPAAHDGSQAHGDPGARLRFYARNGGRALDLPYFQPALKPGGQRVYGLILAVLAASDAAAGARPDHLAAGPLRRFLTEYLESTEGSAGPDPAVDALWRGLERPGGVPLLPLDEPDRLPVSTKDGPAPPA